MAFINKETFEIFTSCMIGDTDIKDVDLVDLANKITKAGINIEKVNSNNINNSNNIMY